MVHNQPEMLGEIIKTAREKSDLTVEELTARVGISERYLYRIENEGKVPKFDVLKELVREVSAAVLLEGIGAGIVREHIAADDPAVGYTAGCRGRLVQ